MTQLSEQQKQLNEILSNNGFDFVDAFEIEEWIKDESDIVDKLQDRVSEQDIIYYSKAMEYLAENDASLRESLELAQDCGYEAKALNSELLATILYQQKLSEKISTVVSGIESYFSDKEAA